MQVCRVSSMSVEKRMFPKPVTSDCFTPTYINGKVQYPPSKKIDITTLFYPRDPYLQNKNTPLMCWTTKVTPASPRKFWHAELQIITVHTGSFLFLIDPVTMALDFARFLLFWKNKTHIRNSTLWHNYSSSPSNTKD